MKRFACLVIALGGMFLAAGSARADFGSCHYGGYQPWYNIFAKRPCMSAEEERLLYKTALVVPYVGQAGTPPAGATLDQKARSYMHANCSFCHRPQGQFPNFDLRFDTTLAAASICNVATKKTAQTITALC